MSVLGDIARVVAVVVGIAIVGLVVGVVLLTPIVRRQRVRRQIGSYDWADATRGALTAPEKWMLRVPVLAAAGVYLWDRILRVLGGDRPTPAAANWQPPTEPTSPLATAAKREWEVDLIGVPDTVLHDDDQARLRCLYTHSLRTWVFARELAKRAGDQLDDDLLYVACLGHDRGLADRVLGDRAPDCFSRLGADDVGRLATTLPAGQPGVDRAKEAIVHHLTPGVTTKVDDALGVYVQQGSLCDLTRQRARLVRHIDLDRLCEVYPRRIPTSSPTQWIELADLAAELWPIESEVAPDGRARLLNMWGCLIWFMKRRPFGVCPKPAPADSDRPAST